MIHTGNRKGFTLIELLIVIAIIGILAAISLSVTLAARKRAADAKTKSRVQDLLKAWVTYSSDHSSYQDICSPSLVLDTSNITGAPSLLDDLTTTQSISPAYDSTGIYAAASPSTGCLYSTGDFTASAIAVGAQLSVDVAPDAQVNMYPTGSSGAAIDGVFDTSSIGSLPWFAKAQQ